MFSLLWRWEKQKGAAQEGFTDAQGAGGNSSEGKGLDSRHGPALPLDPTQDADAIRLRAAQERITAVSIPHYRVRGHYVEYTIECTAATTAIATHPPSGSGTSVWRVHRRYQQFKALDQRLRQLCSRGSPHHCAYGVLPVLPGSHWMEVTNQSSELVDKRRRFLEIYLQQLLVPRNLFDAAQTQLHPFLRDDTIWVERRGAYAGPRPLLGYYPAGCSGEAGHTALTTDTVTSSNPKCSGAHSSDSEAKESICSRMASSEKGKSIILSCPDCSLNLAASTEPREQDEPSALATATPPAAQHLVITTATSGDVGRGLCEESGTHAAGEIDVNEVSIQELSVEDDIPSEVDSVRSSQASSPLQLRFHLSPNCVFCNELFTPTVHPHHCYFCRGRFCRRCLWRLRLCANVDTDDPLRGGEEWVKACGQCTENYKRRLARYTIADGSAATTSQPLTPLPAGAFLCTPRALHTGLAADSALTGEGLTSLSLPLSVPPLAQCSPAEVTAPPVLTGLKDICLLTVIGRGSFGKVFKVRHRATGTTYAMKMLDKATVHRRCMTSYVREEKAILSLLPSHPYVLRCHCAFQTERHVFIVLEYLPGGELYRLLYPTLHLTAAAARLYAAELVLAIEHIHKHNVAHRDIKPENIILDAEGHACLTDFGLARQNFTHTRRRSLVGSAEYLAPETIDGELQTTALDWWSFGVVLYELLSGRTPFHANNTNNVYNNVLHTAPDLSGDCFTPEARELIAALLERDVGRRLQSAEAIKTHPYFAGAVDWGALARREVPAPHVPDVRFNDTRYAKQRFTAEWAVIPPPSTTMSRRSVEMLIRCFDSFPLISVNDSTKEGEETGTAAPSPPSPPLALSMGRCSEPPSRTAWTAVPVTSATLAGTWHVVRVETVAEDGRVTYPWGGEVEGMLIYSPSQHYSMQLSPSHLPRSGGYNVMEAPRDELAELLLTSVSHCGTYTLHSEGGGREANQQPSSAGEPASSVTAVMVLYVASGSGGLCPVGAGQPLSLHCDMEACEEGSGACTLMYLTTLPQRVPEESFMAKTVTVWEKIA